MEEIKRLSIVIEHWIEHNQSHREEYQKWAQKAHALGLDRVKTQIEEAAHFITQSNHCLEKALKAIPSS